MTTAAADTPMSEEDYAISENDFYSKYKPLKNHLSEGAAYDGFMFETYGDEYEFVKEHVKACKVWTVVECDDGELAIIAGFHLVNRMGYIVTEVPWEDSGLFVEEDD